MQHVGTGPVITQEELEEQEMLNYKTLQWAFLISEEFTDWIKTNDDVKKYIGKVNFVHLA